MSRTNPELGKVEHPAIRSSPASNLALYNELVAHAKLESVMLVKLASELRIENFSHSGREEIIVPPCEFQAAVLAKARRLQCGARLTVFVGTVERPAFEMIAEYALVYQTPESFKIDKKLGLQFAQRNGLFNAWPFFRELVHSTAARMGLPQLVVPLLTLPPERPSRK